MINNLKEVFKFKELAKNLIMRELKVKYTNSVLGFFWALLNPLLTAAIFAVIFTVIIKIKVENYPIFLLCAIFPWTFFQMSLFSSVISITGNSPLVRNVNFPIEILPFSAIISNLLHFFIEIFILCIILVISNVKLSLPIFFLPVLLLIHLLITFGMSLLISSLFVFFKDVQFILNFILRLLFYCLPIIYPVEFIPIKIRSLYFLNPLAVLINSYREILFYGRLPNLGFLLIAFLQSLLIFILGYFFFNRFRALIAERV